MKKSIANVAVLDITSANEKIIDEIESIKNVATLIYSPETAHLITRLSISNVANSCQVTGEPKLINGFFEINHSSCAESQKPLSMIVNGTLFVKPDVTAEDLEKNFSDFFVNGRVLCPEKLLFTFQTYLKRLNGKTIIYGENDKLIMNDITFNQNMLESIKEPTSFVITGKVTLLDEIEPELLEEKIKSLRVYKSLTIQEKYRQIIEKKLSSETKAKMTVVPKGYEYITNELVLDGVTITKFKKAKILTKNIIRFENDVNEEMVREHIAAIKSDEIVFCNKEIYEIVSELCESSSTNILYYSGKLVVADGLYVLTNAQLKYLPEKFSLLVNGCLQVDDEIQPDILFEKLEFVDNFGQIVANTEIHGLLQTKIRTIKGELQNSDKKKDKKSDDYAIRNAAFLKL